MIVFNIGAQNTDSGHGVGLAISFGLMGIGYEVLNQALSDMMVQSAIVIDVIFVKLVFSRMWSNPNLKDRFRNVEQ